MKQHKIIWTLIFVITSVVAKSQITSNFDKDDEGWTFTSPITHNASGGDPGAYISSTYSSLVNSTTQYWIAPAKFTGNLVIRSLGQDLTFSMQQSVAGTGNITTGDVRIESGGSQIVFSLPIKPTVPPKWSTYTLKLDETQGWLWSSTTGALATRAQIIQILTNVTSLEIRASYITNANYTSAIDAVTIGQSTLGTPPAISSYSPTSGKPGASIIIQGAGFASTALQNAVYFGAIEGAITSASPTSLTVTVPTGAQYGPVTVINKTTGLSRQSRKPFNPTFDGGGRLIPASFDPKVDITLDPGAGNNIRGLVTADMDGDGWNDLLVAESSLNGVSIFRNNGTGGDLTTSSFALKITLPNAGNGGGLRVIDLDGDGKLDIACGYTSASFSYFATYRNTSTPGKLNFDPVELWPGLVYSSSLSAIEDVDGDGRFDLIGQHGNGSVNVDFWIAQNISVPGNIEFAASRSFFGNATLDAGNGVTTGDLDNDGLPEIIVKHGFGNQFHIIKNNSTPGNILFGTPFPIVQSSFGDVVIADFNLDGTNDIAWKQGSSNDDVHIRINTNKGAPVDVGDFATEIILDSDLFNYGAISIGDMNGDGKPDLLATDSRQLGMFENIFDGGAFSASSFIRSHVWEASGTSTYPTAILPTDMNGDMKPDLVVGITNTNPVRILIYENKNVLAPVISLNTVSPLKGAIGSTVTITGDNFSAKADENKVFFGAAKATVLTATKTLLTVSVPAGASMAPVSVTRDNLTARYHLPFVPTFSPGVIFNGSHFSPPVNFLLTTADYDIEVGDLNLDGKPDVVAEGLTNRAYSFLNTHSSGAISLSSLTANDTTTSTTGNPILVDIDEDGFADILSANGLYRNVSTGSKIEFMPLTSFANGTNSSFGDFNLDGKTDILGANGTNVSVGENRSPRPALFTIGAYPTISPNFNYTKPATGGGTASADFDNDGWTDFVATNPATDNITVWRNNGEFRISTTEFTAQPVIAVGDNPGRIYKGDMDVDGKMDLVIYYSNITTSQFITVLHNQSTPGNISFNRFDYALGALATVAHISDLDGDGKPEILVTSETTDQFFILKNTSTPGTMNASSFAAPFPTAVNNPRGISTGDINLDGKPEILISSAPNSLLVFENLVPTGPTISISKQPDNASVCDGTIATFTTEAIGVTNISYRWQLFDGNLFQDINNGGGYSGATTNTLSVNTTGSFGSGDYRCKISGDLASDTFTNRVTLVINKLPAPPNVTGDSECVSPATLILNATGTTNGNYNWYDVQTGGKSLGSNSAFTTPSIAATTTYYVSISNPFCESARVPVDAAINLLTKPIITFDPPISNAGSTINLCEGDVQKFSAPAGFSRYLWSNNETTREIVVDVAGTYTVIVGDASGCLSPSSDPLNVAINPYPKAIITLSGTTLTTSSGDNYQWFQNDKAVNGAISQNFDLPVLEYGVYKVDVTSKGCTTTSSDFVYLITAHEETFHEQFTTYPNPFSDKIFINWKSSKPGEIQIINSMGQETKTQNLKSGANELDSQLLSPGVYLLLIRTEQKNYLIKGIKK